MLRASLDDRRDAHRADLAVQQLHHALDVGLALAPLLVQELGDLPVELGLGVAEREVLELPLHVGDAEAVGERREELERLGAGGAAQGLVGPGERAQVHHPLGQLDQHHAHVLGDGEQHLPQLLQVRAAGVERLDAPGAGEAAQERRELRAERFLHRFQVQVALGDGLAHEGGGDGLGIGALHQQQARHGERALEALVAAGGARRGTGELQGAGRQLGRGGAEGRAQLRLEGRDVGGGGGAQHGGQVFRNVVTGGF